MVQQEYIVCLCVDLLCVQNGCGRCVAIAFCYFILPSQYEDRDNNIESACIEKKTDTVDIKLLPEEEPGM